MTGTMENHQRTALYRTLLFTMMIGTSMTLLTKIDPQQNMWVTWANQTGQPSFCLSLASASDPFRTCLFGVPIGDPKELAKKL